MTATTLGKLWGPLVTERLSLARVRTLWGFASIFVLFATSSAASAQLMVPKIHCQAPQTPQVLELNIEGRLIDLNGKSGLHWVVNGLTEGAAIDISDSQLKSAVVEWIASQNGPDGKPKHEWVLDGRTPWSLLSPSGLNGGLAAGFTILPYPFIPPPSTPQPVRPYPITFCAAKAAKMRLDTLEIQVASESYDFEKPKPDHKLQAPEANVTASALLSDSDANGDQQALLNAYSGVAETAWGAAKKNGIVLGSSIDNSVLRKAEGAISAIYKMAQDNIPYQFWGLWPEPRAIFQYTKAGACCILLVQNVRMAQHAIIRVEANLPNSGPQSQEGKKAQTPDGMTDHPETIPANPPVPQNPKQRRAADLARRTQDTLNKRFASELARFQNTVPTFDQVDRLRSRLAAAHEVYPTVRLGILEGQPGTIVFDADNRWTIGNVTLSAGAGYTVEDKGTGKVDFQGENLVGSVFNHRDMLDPKEAENLTYSGGNEVQKSNASWGLSWTHSFPSTAQSTYGVQVFGDYLQDHNQRFGNETGPILRDHEIGWGPA